MSSKILLKIALIVSAMAVGAVLLSAGRGVLGKPEFISNSNYEDAYGGAVALIFLAGISAGFALTKACMLWRNR